MASPRKAGVVKTRSISIVKGVVIVTPQIFKAFFKCLGSLIHVTGGRLHIECLDLCSFVHIPVCKTEKAHGAVTRRTEQVKEPVGELLVVRNYKLK